jgi:hypothetical protein
MVSKGEKCIQPPAMKSCPAIPQSTKIIKMKRRMANLPLHSGKAPPWLFKRMTKLAEAVTMAIVEEFGPAEMLRRLSDPWWFQAFGCVLGFDWHSSGVTTVTCGALKEAAKVCGPDLGILVAGGKGGTSRKTPQEIADASDRHAITEGPTLFAPARHPVLDLDVDRKHLTRILSSVHEQNPQDFETLLGLQGIGPATVRSLALLAEIIFQAPPSRRDPTVKYVGNQGDYRDKRRWADYSHAHGGKDGTPFPVDRDTYDRNIVVLTDAVCRARLGENDKLDALRRLSKLGGA